MKNFYGFVLSVSVCWLCGCASVQEPFKVVWGSSTRALEKARPHAATEIFRCTPAQCFDEVVALSAQQERISTESAPKDSSSTTRARPEDEKEDDDLLLPTKTPQLNIFLKDPSKKVIVFMGIPGSINTTEVGVFFVPVENSGTRIEVSSLSKNAKIRAAEILFTELKKIYPAAVSKPAASRTEIPAQ